MKAPLGCTFQICCMYNVDIIYIYLYHLTYDFSILFNLLYTRFAEHPSLLRTLFIRDDQGVGMGLIQSRLMDILYLYLYYTIYTYTLENVTND